MSVDQVVGVLPFDRENTCTCSGASGQFVKHGNNGIVSCSTYCAGSQWGPVGTAVRADVLSIPTDFIPGLLQNGAEMTAVCKGPNASALNTSSIQSLGYFASAFNDVGTGDYISNPDIFGHTDTVWVRALDNAGGSGVITNENVNEVIQRLQEAQNYGLKAVVDVEGVLFGIQTTNLVSDPVSTFSAFQNALITAGVVSTVVGYFIFDEPFLNNQNPFWQQVSPGQLFENLFSAISAVNQAAPGIPTILNFSYPEVSGEIWMGIPQNADVVGFDCYEAGGCTDAQVTSGFNHLVAAKVPNQKLMVLPDTFSRSLDETVPADSMRYWQKLMSSNSDVTFISLFKYSSDPATGDYSAQSLPDIRTGWSAFWEGLRGTLACDGDDLLRPATGERWTSAWMCQPRCSGTDLVRTNVLGQEIGRWVNAPMCTATQQIMFEHSGKCLAATDSTGVQQMTCNAADSKQQWNLNSIAANQYSIVNQWTQNCLEVAGASTSPGAPIQQNSCSGTAQQIWQLNDIGTNIYALINSASGLGLDVPGSSRDDRAPIDQYPVASGSQLNSLCGLRSQYREPF